MQSSRKKQGRTIPKNEEILNSLFRIYTEKRKDIPKNDETFKGKRLHHNFELFKYIIKRIGFHKLMKVACEVS